MNYVRTFFKALQMTLRGEAITRQASRYPNLSAWLGTAQTKLKHVYTVLEANQINEVQQKTIQIELDGRPWTMQLILSAIDFHLNTEFPSLMESVIEHNLTTLYALHFDDKYRIGKLAELDSLPAPVQLAIQDFANHFMAIPPSTDP